MVKLLKKKLNKKGFTLIELIVVIAIVAILAVVGIPAIAGQVAKANISAAEANAKTIFSQASLMITEAEVAGTALATIKTAVQTGNAPSAAVLLAAGIDSTKVGTVTMSLIELDKDGKLVGSTGAGTAVTCAVGSVTVTKGSAVGEFKRTT